MTKTHKTLQFPLFFFLKVLRFLFFFFLFLDGLQQSLPIYLTDFKKRKENLPTDSLIQLFFCPAWCLHWPVKQEMLSHCQCAEQDIVLGTNTQLCPDGSELSPYVLPINNNGTRARWIQTSQQGTDIRKEKNNPVRQHAISSSLRYPEAWFSILRVTPIQSSIVIEISLMVWV